jgi:hypothetical protein
LTNADESLTRKKRMFSFNYDNPEAIYFYQTLKDRIESIRVSEKGESEKVCSEVVSKEREGQT